MHSKQCKKLIAMNIVLDVLRYLNEHGITLVRAAEATGVAQQNIKKSIGNNPKTSTLLALAKGLGVDPREFFYDLDEIEEDEKKGIQGRLEETHFPEATDVAEEKTEEASDAEAQRAGIKGGEGTTGSSIINTTAFCPHSGARVRVGVVLLPEL